MIWGGFSATGTTELYILEKGLTMDYVMYLDCLTSTALPGFNNLNCGDFLDDKAPCHRHKD